MLKSLKHKILLANSTFVIVVVLSTLFVGYQINQTQGLASEEQQIIEQLSELTKIEKNFFEMKESGLLFSMLFRDKTQEKMKSSYNKILSLIDSNEADSLKILSGHVNEYHTLLEEVSLAFIDDDKVKGSLLLSQAETLSSTINEVLATHVQKLEKQGVELSLANEKRREHTSDVIKTSIYSQIVLIIILGIGFSVLLSKLIISPLINLRKTVSTIQDQGDLTLRSHIESTDEIGDLSRSFNTMLSSLNGIVSNVRKQSEEVSTSASELSTITTQTVAGTKEQSQRTNELADVIHN